MKKMFSFLAVVPCGFWLAGIMVLFVGCARLQYQDPAGNVRISGFTTTPEMAMVMSAEAEAVRAQAYATRKCSDDPRNCGAVNGGWGMGVMDTPAGYTWAGINAGAVAQPVLPSVPVAQPPPTTVIKSSPPPVKVVEQKKKEVEAGSKVRVIKLPAWTHSK
jgi:hypothetical protein